MKIFLKFFIFTFLASILIFSCKNGDDGQTDTTPNDTDSVYVEEQIEQAKEIFYSLPAPHEVSSILLQDNSSYFNEKILNPVENSANYTTEASQAYNLGVYLADLSYANLFDQNQIVINYMAHAQELADHLGLLAAFDQETIDKLEENVNNRDEIMRILSDIFMNTDAYLQENQKQELGAMILIGGWVEGLYLATKLSDCDISKNQALVSSILEQKLSLELMQKFLESLNSKRLDLVNSDINELYNLYENTNTEVTDEGYLKCSQEDFTKLCTKIDEIRKKIVNSF